MYQKIAKTIILFRKQSVDLKTSQLSIGNRFCAMQLEKLNIVFKLHFFAID